MNPAWLFVLATVIAVLGILYAFKQMIVKIQEKVENGQEVKAESIQKEQTNFFIKVAMFEAIPILLIVYGFMQIGIEDENYSIILPLIIIAGILIFALVQILALKRDLSVQNDRFSPETIGLVNTLIMIGMAMVSAIPIVSVVAILTMSG